MGFTIINKKDWSSKLGIICGILNQEYLKMRVKKVNIFKDIKLENFNLIKTFFFDLQKLDITFMP